MQIVVLHDIISGAFAQLSILLINLIIQCRLNVSERLMGLGELLNSSKQIDMCNCFNLTPVKESRLCTVPRFYWIDKRIMLCV